MSEPKISTGTNIHITYRVNWEYNDEYYYRQEGNGEVCAIFANENVAKTFDLNNLEIVLPAGERKTLVKNFTFNEQTRVVLLTSHFHKLGEKFVIKIYGGPRNGEIIYTNTDWEHPASISYTTPIVLKAGEGLTSEVTYYNKTNKTVTFGLTSEDEMNIIFGYYY